MRTIAIGDIHGCLEALDGLIAEIKPQEDDRLIFLGDYVDRGPDSRGVIQRLLELRKRCAPVFLLGNHEIIFRSVLAGLPSDKWLEVGGKQTLASYGGSLEAVPATHIAFLYELLPYFETENNLFIHANYDATLPMSQQTEQMLYWEHLGAKLPSPHFSGKHVYLGHTPQANLEIGWYGHFTCIDTYCFGGGWLTAIDVKSGQIWQISQKGKARKNGMWAKLLWRKFLALLGQASIEHRKTPLTEQK